MNAAVKSKTIGGTTLAQQNFVEMKLKGGWRCMWFATFLSPIFPIAIILACVGLGHGIGATTYPGYSGRGLKLAFWSVMGPLTPWILFVSAGLLWRQFH